MTPARRAKLEAALAIIRNINDADDWAALTCEARDSLMGIGAQFVFGNTNTLRLAGVTASCTWDNGEQLVLRWAANARKALAEADPADTNSEEEE
ncbi:hypothetical protein ACLBKU_11865 [Erythrobacter sp. NE805]|uniref:hypothetical protein n=1 Tax=Erythrobacter sp. NE805 TaxID=3389875 RepID=UPI00396B1E68